ETKYAAAQAPSNGNKPFICPVVSNANTTEVRNALDAPANIAAIPISAAVGRLISSVGNKYNNNIPSNAPAAPPMVSNGASVPPDVPLPSDTTHEMNFRKQSDNNIAMGSPPPS